MTDFLSEIAPLLGTPDEKLAAEDHTTPVHLDGSEPSKSELESWARSLAFQYGRHGLPVRQIAALVGWSHSTVHRWLRQASCTASTRPHLLSHSVEELNRDAARLRVAMGKHSQAADAASEVASQRTARSIAHDADMQRMSTQLQEHEDAIALLRQQNKTLLAAITAIRQHLGM